MTSLLERDTVYWDYAQFDSYFCLHYTFHLIIVNEKMAMYKKIPMVGPAMQKKGAKTAQWYRMPVIRNANIHTYGSSKRRGLEVPRSNNVSQTLFHVSRRSKQ